MFTILGEPSEAISVEDLAYKMCLPFSFQGRVKVPLKIIVRKNRDFQKNLEYLGIFRNFWGYLEIFGGIFRGKIENFWIDF